MMDEDEKGDKLGGRLRYVLRIVAYWRWGIP